MIVVPLLQQILDRNDQRETGLFLLFQRVLSLAAWPQAVEKNPMGAGLVTYEVSPPHGGWEAESKKGPGTGTPSKACPQ